MRHTEILKEGQYGASRPYKCEHPEFPTNIDIANKRTRAMIRRLAPDLRQTYNKIINEQKPLQFIEKVHNDGGEGNYIPYHAVAKNRTQLLSGLGLTACARPEINQALMFV